MTHSSKMGYPKGYFAGLLPSTPRVLRSYCKKPGKIYDELMSRLEVPTRSGTVHGSAWNACFDESGPVVGEQEGDAGASMKYLGLRIGGGGGLSLLGCG